MIRGSDGLEYADEAALLLREPIDNTFNGNVRAYRGVAEHYRRDPSLLRYVSAGRAYWTEERVRKYIEGFLSVCPEGDPGPSQAFGVAHDTGLKAAGFRSARRNFYHRPESFGSITIDVATGAPTLSAF